MTPRRITVLVGALALPLAAACSSNEPEASIVRVGPGDDVQAAIDDATDGDLILLEAGEYRAELVVETPGITLRGVDRNDVVFDGGGEMVAGVLVAADGVAVENLTATDYILGGVVVSGETSDDAQLDGFRVAHVTAYNNETYGIYALQAGNGVIADSYASGHPDSGIYVGQCGNPDPDGQPDGAADDAGAEPCNVSVRDVVAEYNALGYSGTNASQVWITNSVFRNNRIGITPNSQSLERRSPQTAATIAGNLVVDNGDPAAPEQASGGTGVGISIGSGVGNVVIENYVAGNPRGGILVEVLDPFLPVGNRVADNVLSGNGLDLGYWVTGGETAIAGNCFAGNRFETSEPADIERAMACDGASEGTVVSEPLPLSASEPAPGPVPAPEPQPTMDGDVEAFPDPPAFVEPDLDTIEVPTP